MNMLALCRRIILAIAAARKMIPVGPHVGHHDEKIEIILEPDI